MSSNPVPFHTQAALLERYAQSSELSHLPEVVDFIVDLLRSSEALAAQFFRSRPHAEWAPILWKRGFFANAPEPELAEGGYRLPIWHEQDYLISVAAQQPELILQHVVTVEGHGRYLSKAVQGLCLIPVQLANTVVGRVCDWLRNPQTAEDIASPVFDLLIRFAEHGETQAAFALYRDFLAPLPPYQVRHSGGFSLDGEARAKFARLWKADDILGHCTRLLRDLDPQETILVLEESLLATLRQEANERELADSKSSSWWRAKIEEREQKHGNVFRYKDRLVDALRDTWEWLALTRPDPANELLRHHLDHEQGILRRIGLHVLQGYSRTFPSLVKDELLKVENLNDTGIQREYFLLLRSGFACLDPQGQEELTDAVLRGPAQHLLDRWVEYAKQMGPELGVHAYVEQRWKSWICDRLWMIGPNLPARARNTLNELIEELGEPADPAAIYDFRTSSFRVESVSPLSEDEILQMTPDALVQYLQHWTPPSNQDFGPRELSYGGLADTLSSVIVRNVDAYKNHLVEIAICRSVYAYRILGRYQEDTLVGSRPWKLLLEFCEGLLACSLVRSDVAVSYDESWREVRKAIIHLLHYGLANEDNPIADEYLERVRDLILVLIDDPDPDAKADNPPQGSFGYRDPVSVAINHVRSMALEALIAYAQRVRVRNRGDCVETPLQSRVCNLEPVVQNALTTRLDRAIEPTLAVHSMYGLHFGILHWLDPEWATAHIDDIFPAETDEDSRWMFAAAFEAFVSHNRAPFHLFQLLEPKYRWAIDCLKQQFVTKSVAGTGKGLAIHLTGHYLAGNFDLLSPSTDGQQDLLEMFFAMVPPDARSHVAWCVWRVAEDDPDYLQYWPRMRRLWERRIQVASSADYSPEFDDEMQWFAKLALLAPLQETLTTLWPLLEGLLPHVTRSEYVDIGWDALSEYLAREVERDPLRAVQMYWLLYDQTSRPQSFYSGTHERKIIEIAAQDAMSREAACWLIDAIARDGDLERYRDIYDRCCT